MSRLDTIVIDLFKSNKSISEISQCVDLVPSKIETILKNNSEITEEHLRQIDERKKEGELNGYWS